MLGNTLSCQDFDEKTGVQWWNVTKYIYSRAVQVQFWHIFTWVFLFYATLYFYFYIYDPFPTSCR